MKRFKDERITKEINKMASKIYWPMLLMLLISFLAKIYNRMELISYSLELLCFAITIPYLIISMVSKGIFLTKTTDECVTEKKNAIFSICSLIIFCLLITGEFVLMTLYKDNIIIYVPYLIIWLLPGSILYVFSLKKGLFTLGGDMRKRETTSPLKKGAVKSALIFGVLMGVPKVYNNGCFHATGLLWMIAYALPFGIFMYVFNKYIYKKSDKYADAQVVSVGGEEDVSCEKQENENSQN